MANRVIGTELKLTGEKEFNAQMKSINSGLKTTRSDMAALSAEFDDNANSMQALTAKQKLLRTSVDQHQAKVDALRAQYEASAATLGENAARTQKYKQELNSATIALLKEESALKKTTSALENAKSETEPYVAVTQRLATALKKPAADLKGLKDAAKEAAREMPILAELMDIVGVSSKGLQIAGKGASATLKGIGAAAGGVAKGVGLISAASAAGVAAIGAGGIVALTTMTNMAREAAEAAKEAKESGKKLTASQKQWLAYSKQLDKLDASVAKAKSALGAVLLPVLSELSKEGAAFLNGFSKDMAAAAGDTEQQTKVLSEYIVKGATLIKEKLPEYISAGKELFGGIAAGLGESGPELLDMGLDLLMDLLNGIINYAPELAAAGIELVQKLTEGMIERGPDVLESAVLMVSQIVTGLAQAAPSLIPAAVQLVMQLVTALIKSSPELLAAGLELIYGLIKGLIEGLGVIAESADQIVDTFKTAFEGKIDTFLSIGSKIINLIQDGISDAWDGLVNWFNNLWDSLFKGRSVEVGVNGSGSGVDGSHAGGLDYVPFDGYIAELHRGETILSAAEAAAYRSNKSGAVNKIFNLTINTQSLSKEELDAIVEYMNRKLGDDL